MGRDRHRFRLRPGQLPDEPVTAATMAIALDDAIVELESMTLPMTDKQEFFFTLALVIIEIFLF